MSLWTGFARRWLDLPAPRCRTSGSLDWLATRDGTRLATAVERPLGTEPRSCVLVRTAAPVAGERSRVRAAARLLAEQGHAVVAQTCRGLHASEGRFQPFLDEARDGADLRDWAARQPWFRRPLVVAGAGYGGFAAWAAASGDEPADGLIVGFGTRDPHRWLYVDGALRLELALGLAIALAVAESAPDHPADLARALRHRPLREADRVALRRVDWWAEWLDHPRRDAWWQERCANPKQLPGSSLLVGAFGEPSFEAMQADHEQLCAASPESPGRKRLLIGSREPLPGGRARRRRDAALRREVAREVLAFLDALAGGRERPAPVRAFVGGTLRWRDAAAWPPAGTAARELHLRGDGRARGDGAGELREAPPADAEPPDRYVYDPADAPCFAGDAGETDGRGDVLRYLGAPAASDYEIAGAPRLLLFADSDAARTDFFARLLAIAPSSPPLPISHGLARDAPGEDGAAIEIPLAPLWRHVPAGTRLALEISSSGFPHFARHPNTRESPTRSRDGAGVPALQLVWHDARRPSRLWLPVLAGSGG